MTEKSEISQENESQEKVLVISKEDFAFEEDFGESALLMTGPLLGQAFANTLSSAFFVDRTKAEHDPNFKQLIPYVVIRRGNEYAVYQRTKRGGESRLHDKWSLGFGGHVNPVDDRRTDVLDAALRRELKEELGLHLPYNTFSPVAFLYDDSDEVGRVHLGLVYEIRIGLNEPLSPRDPSLANVRFEHRLEIQRRAKEFENWSQLVITHIL